MKPILVYLLPSTFFLFYIFFLVALGLVAAGIGQVVFNFVSQHVRATYFPPYTENLL